MYHGGTNFGFLNGANTDEAGTKYAPDVTSYDYDSLVSEAGVLTAKGVRTKEILKVHGLFPDGVGDGPPAPEFAAYGEKVVNEWLPLDQIKTVMNGRTKLANVVPMEQLRYKKGAEPDEKLYGQSYGYIIYDHVIENQDGDLVVEEFHDRAMIFLDGRIQRILEFTESMKKDHVIQVHRYKMLFRSHTVFRCAIFCSMNMTEKFWNPKPRDVPLRGSSFLLFLLLKCRRLLSTGIPMVILAFFS